MALPWLTKPRQQGGISVEVRNPDENKDEGHDESGLEACFEDLMQAVELKDKKRGAAALKSAFEILDSEPHVEGPHTNENEEQE